MRRSLLALFLGTVGLVGCTTPNDDSQLSSGLGLGDTKELVTCVFNSQIPQECVSLKGSCKGTGSCTVEVLGNKGDKVEWKSTCGGYATTVVDGLDEKAYFDCAVPPQPPPPQIKEQVFCVFNSSAPQACYASNGAGCKGTGSCMAVVTGQQGDKIDWKSTCGGYAGTILDGVDEKILFDCAPVPPPPPPPQLKEQVKCLFNNTKVAQECTSAKGSCKGLGACVVDVIGLKGEKVDWKSTCGGYATTLIDGISEYAVFDCNPQPPPPTTKEQVFCVFNSAIEQACYASNGAGCKGTGFCIAVVSGQKGDKIEWKSSCGGYATTLLDGLDEKAYFDCGITPPPPPPPPTLKEQVYCIFANSAATVEQACYSSTGAGCKGFGSCIAVVSGQKGDKIDWKSSCGGYATTLLDGLDEKILFDCGATPPPPPPPPPELKELVTCVFACATASMVPNECVSAKGACKGVGSCQVAVSGQKGEKVDWKSTCGGYATTLIDGIDEKILF
jgi:hypothetical protein